MRPRLNNPERQRGDGLLRFAAILALCGFAFAQQPTFRVDVSLVRVLATSINPVDYKIRSGAAKDRMPVEFPAILGRDLSGEVAAFGPSVTGFPKGLCVMGLANGQARTLLGAGKQMSAQGLVRVDSKGNLPYHGVSRR